MFEQASYCYLPERILTSIRRYVPYIGIVLGVIGCLTSVGILLLQPSIPAAQANNADICVNQEFKSEIVVYVSGAVQTSGIYKLPSGSRLADALNIAGGPTVQADRMLLQKEFNLAQELVESQHIYIPYINELSATNLAQSQTEAMVLAQTTTQPSLISVNTASQSELETLPKVGEKTAEKIIAGRPYTDLFQLVSTKVLSQSIYDEIKGQLSL